MMGEGPEMDSLGIEGARVRTPRIQRDDRGSFLESFRADELALDLGYRFEVAQANCSVSRRGVIRGIHFADVPPGHAKYVSCVRGAIVDIVVDLRVASPTFGRWEAVRLDEENRCSVYIAEGLVHAFMALTDECTVVYLRSTPYKPGGEHGIDPLDPAIGIEWPADVEPLLSPIDAAAPSLADAERAGLLPRYADCVAYTAQLRDSDPGVDADSRP
jgi:dTDP-4-dehydrorhamnose 3,5-epimerase